MKSVFRQAALALWVAAGASAATGCSERAPEQTSDIPHIMKPISTTATAQDWQTLTRLRIAFGHQSVGSNLIAGIESLAREHDIPVSIAETTAAFSAPGIHHFKIGKNEAPQTKLRDFAVVMMDGVAQSADIALMKLCYIDFAAATNATQLAQAYIGEIEQLSARYPNTVFVPVTAPLTTVQTGPRALIKKLIGSVPAGYAENAQRQVFNAALREHYARQSRLFDLAALESSLGRIGIEYQGKHVESLDPTLTDDGGHLNAQGQRLLGGALVHHLAALKQR